MISSGYPTECRGSRYMIDEPGLDAETRASEFAQHANLAWVAGVLEQRRDTILKNWLESARAQPFHEGKLQAAVADHIPGLFDSIVAVLQKSAARWLDPSPVLEDPAVLQAARDHARVRFAQGLESADVVTEFRLLRQEIGRALRVHLSDQAPASDILAAELLVHDAIDGAIGLALTALGRHVEEVRQDFLATTIHDVAQPLATIKARVQLAVKQLGRGEPAIAQAVSGLQGVAGDVDRLTRMLMGLADASRLALGDFQLRRSPLDLRELVRAAVARLESGQRMRLRVAAQEEVTGEWDRDLLERVLDNVLSNALKYSPPGTPIEISLLAENGFAQLAVHDQGIGLSSDELELVFERYRRAPAAVAGGVKGQGLGLYLARGVVEAHGGRMWLESPGPGFGTTVFVRLRCHT
jgi:signal transduction histidine kinase